MEQDTNAVDSSLEIAENDLLMKVEEQIFTQVADESNEESDEDGDPVMVTCGKLIISASDKEEKEENQDETLTEADFFQSIEKVGDTFFTIKSIEKIEEEDFEFEAVFEVNSDIDEIGLSESDIKALEFIESKEYIVLTERDEKPQTDDFSSSVLKFQDAIENYTKAVYSGISDTICGLEKVKNPNHETEHSHFSETISEVTETYAGRIPVEEEIFEEVKSSVCGKSENHEDRSYNSFVQPFDSELFAEISNCSLPNIDLTAEQIVKKNVKDLPLDTDNLYFSETISELTETYLERTPVEEEPFEEIKISGENEDSNHNSFAPTFENGSLAEISNSLLLNIDLVENKELCCESSTKDTPHFNNVIIEADTNGVESLENSKIENIENFNEDNIDIEVQNEEKNVSNPNEPSNFSDSIIGNSKIPQLLQLDTNFITEVEANCIDQESNITAVEVLGNEEEYNQMTKNMNEINEKEPTSKSPEHIEPNLPITKIEIYQSEIKQEKEERQIDNYTKNANKGIQRNAESRKSKKNMKIQNQASLIQGNVEEIQSLSRWDTSCESFNEPRNTKTEKATKKVEETKLLVNTILFITLALFLFLIYGDTFSYSPASETARHGRIPAPVSSVIEGYVQLSGLAEMELRK